MSNYSEIRTDLRYFLFKIPLKDSKVSGNIMVIYENRTCIIQKITERA
jgi:hypothetical protein